MELMGIEPTTSALRTQGGRDASVDIKQVAELLPPAYTTAYTDDVKTMQDVVAADLQLAVILNAWFDLPSVVRRGIVAMVETSKG